MKLKKGNKRYAYLFDKLSGVGVTEKDFIVDCACGGGYGSSILRGKGWTVVGFDISKKCLQEANDRGVPASFADICKMPVEDSIADVFICSETLEHIVSGKSMMKAVGEIKRVCKDDGLVCITVPADKEKCLKNPKHKTYLTTDDLETLFVGWETIFKGEFCKKPGRCNNVIILRGKIDG